MLNLQRITSLAPYFSSSPATRDLPTTKLLNIHLVNSGLPAALDWLCDRLESGTPARIAFLNAHCANISARDADYRAAMESADAVLADGSGISLALRLKGQKLAANLNGTDLIPALCKRMAESRHSIFLLGGKPGIAEAAAAALRSIAPGLKVAGTHHGFFGEAGEAAVIRAINASGADVVLVAMGVPSQDLWLNRNAARLSATLTFGVGGLFDFLSGRIPRAPQWLRKAGLEWTYRLYQEPGRMWRRYILGNPAFVVRAAVDALPNRSAFLKTIDLAAKRAIGFTGAALGILLLLLPLVLVALAIRLTSKGPAILRQTRIGKDGVPFQLYKFRSMYIDAEERRAALLGENRHGADCVTFKLANDPRVTPLGRFLRRSSIDELPQLFNVLEGSMALVGPRPPLPDEVSRYTPHQRRRLAGKPGLTCLWQVSGRANLPFPKQVELDIEYLTHRNVLMDTLIVLRTIPAVLFARGAY
jgi:exopolysaccharide biosynthesis WecB/TagA/CpsF family protein